jgi:F420-dependent oxidoreductase-like protein
MKLGLQLGYWGRGPNPFHVPLAQEAERLGYDSVWVAESWGNDAFSFATWMAAHTESIRVCTGVVQMSGRTPTSCAMHAITVDHLSNGRFALGLGLSGPQVVEGWYGQPYGKPIKRTREYIDVIRQVLRRDADGVAFDGEFVHLPYHGDNSWDMGKPLKVMVHPLRADLPIYLGAEGPKNVALAAEIADGWLPLYYCPEKPEVYDTLPAPAALPANFEIAVTLMGAAILDDDKPETIEAALLGTKAALGFYIGGMGSRSRNFHKELMGRMGYAGEADTIQELFFADRRDDAIAAVPTAFADEISLVGTPARIKDRLAAWEASPVTTIIVSGGPDTLRGFGELV